MIDADSYNRQEDRLRTIGVGVIIGIAGMAVALTWLG
jgi:hypothetical protein